MLVDALAEGVETFSAELYAGVADTASKASVTSYIKDKAPLPGRVIAFGVRAFF